MTYEPTQLWVYAGRGDNYVPSLKPIRVVSVPIGDNTTSFTNNYSTCSDIPEPRRRAAEPGRARRDCRGGFAGSARR